MGCEATERRARAADQVMLDRQNRFGSDGQVAFEQQVEYAQHRAGERVLNGHEQCVRCALGDGAEGRVKRRPRHRRNRLAEKLHRGLLAERPRLALKRHPCSFAGQHRSSRKMKKAAILLGIAARLENSFGSTRLVPPHPRTAASLTAPIQSGR